MISIIVPIYNSERTLACCIDSIISQTYQNFELLLVNDGSTDLSESICLNYVKRYGDIVRYYLKNNGGVSSARNYGIEHANGKYICFVDSDDYVEVTYLEVLHSNLIKYNLDFSMCDIFGSCVEETNETILLEDKNDILYAIISNKYGLKNKGPCCKLFRKEIIRELRFNEEVYLGEDTLFCVEYAKRCNKGVYIRQELYHYDMPTSSLKYKNDKNLLKKYLTYIDSRLEMLKDTSMLNRRSFSLLVNSLFESIQESYFVAQKFGNSNIQYTLCSLMKDYLRSYKLSLNEQNKPITWFIMAYIPQYFDMWMYLYGKYHGFLCKLRL